MARSVNGAISDAVNPIAVKSERLNLLWIPDIVEPVVRQASLSRSGDCEPTICAIQLSRCWNTDAILIGSLRKSAGKNLVVPSSGDSL